MYPLKQGILLNGVFYNQGEEFRRWANLKFYNEEQQESRWFMKWNAKRETRKLQVYNNFLQIQNLFTIAHSAQELQMEI